MMLFQPMSQSMKPFQLHHPRLLPLRRAGRLNLDKTKSMIKADGLPLLRIYHQLTILNHTHPPCQWTHLGISLFGLPDIQKRLAVALFQVEALGNGAERFPRDHELGHVDCFGHPVRVLPAEWGAEFAGGDGCIRRHRALRERDAVKGVAPGWSVRGRGIWCFRRVLFGVV